MNIQISALGMVCFAAVIVGALHMGFQLYKIVSLDAEARGLSRPQLWGFLAIGGNNSSGLITYLILRRKHPVINMPEKIYKEIKSRKKRAAVGIIFWGLGAIGFVITLSLL